VFTQRLSLFILLQYQNNAKTTTMLTNFENYTVELSDDEKKIVPIIIERFKKRPGKENVVTNPKIIDGLQKHFGIKTSEPRIRKIIQFIRLNDLLPGLIATKHGYYLTNDIKELTEWIEQMRQRESIIRESRLIAEKNLRQMILFKNNQLF